MGKKIIKINRQAVVAGAFPVGAMIPLNLLNKREIHNVSVDDFRAEMAKGILLIERVISVQTTIAGFAANSGDYTFQEGDIIIVDDGSGIISLYMYFGGLKTDVANYNQIESNVVEWLAILNKPSLIHRIISVQTTIAGFATNSGDYTFEEGDVISVDDGGGIISLYVYLGVDKTVVGNYLLINKSSLVHRVFPVETNIADFATNSGGYTFEEGDVIRIDDGGGIISLYVYLGVDKTVEANYFSIGNQPTEWMSVINVPAYLLSRVANIVANYIADRNDKYIIADGAATVVNIELPETSVDLEAKEFVIKAIDVTNAVNVYAFESNIYDIDSIQDMGANTFRYLTGGNLIGLAPTDLVKITNCANPDNNGILAVTATDNLTHFEVTNALGVAELASDGSYQKQTFFYTFALAGDVIRLLCNPTFDAYMPV